MKTQTINVKGMHCKSCEALVNDGLSELKGLKSSSADHEKGKVMVEFDEKLLTIHEINKVIENEGYEVKE